MQDNNGLLGKLVEYSLRKGHKSTGIVVDKVTMREKLTDTEQVQVTGYMLLDTENPNVDMQPIAYWRISNVICPNTKCPVICSPITGKWELR